jgi:hypothetical protein
MAAARLHATNGTVPDQMFHHQPEAQHPKSSAIHKLAGRLPHLLALSGHDKGFQRRPLSGVKQTFGSAAAMSANDPFRTSYRARDAPHNFRLTMC